MIIADVLILRGVNRLYSYTIPEDLTVKPGDPVLIPFGRSKAKGVIMSLKEAETSERPLKPIAGLDPKRSPLTAIQYHAFEWLQAQCLCSAYQAYQTVVGNRSLRSDRPKAVPEELLETPHVLTDEQSAVMTALASEPLPALIHGVTGSGKTELYMQLAQKVLSEDKQVLILVPEISLTPQFFAQFKARFGERVVVLHSGLTPKQRDIAWSRVASGEVPMVVGPRSAIFSPFSNIGLIAIDEAHDGAYKQDRHPRYDTVRLAESMARALGIQLVLGTATPLVEQVYQYQADGYHYLRLTQRYATQPLPKVTITDLNETPMAGPFSEDLLTAIQDRLQKKEKTLIMINRRGYAPYVICQACQKPLHCPSCQLGMTYHKDQTFRCHRCDIRQPMTHTCPDCHKDRLAFTGQGTQRIEVELKRRFPQASILRLDRDSATTAKKMESLLTQFKQSGDILVGTQLIAKGHHIEDVTLVGVLGLDTTLNMPDFRAAENTFQLLTQVSGRAGRGDRPGEVWVQTRFPHHYALLTAADHDYDAFYEQELLFREQLGYPPYSRLIHIVARGATALAAKRQLTAWHRKAMASLAEFGMDVAFLGPKPAPFELLRGAYRWHCLIKCFDGAHERLLPQLKTLLIPDKTTAPASQELLGVDCDPRAIL